MQVPLFIINLDRDGDRYLNTVRQLQKYDFISPIRISAFPGRIIPDHICHLLTRNQWSHEHKGTLGCFLSHFSAWESVAKFSDNEFVFVAEDNAQWLRCDILDGLRLPPESDLIFCNARTAYPTASECSAEVAFRPVEKIVPFIETHGRAVGTDGYIITGSGARKLIQFVYQDGLFSHVDLRMLAYALHPTSYPSADAFNKASKTVVQFRQQYPATHQLNAYSMAPPITDRWMSLTSTRSIEDSEGKKSLMKTERESQDLKPA